MFNRHLPVLTDQYSINIELLSIDDQVPRVPDGLKQSLKLFASDIGLIRYQDASFNFSSSDRATVIDQLQLLWQRFVIVISMLLNLPTGNPVPR